jgi:hypothetical protein
MTEKNDLALDYFISENFIYEVPERAIDPGEALGGLQLSIDGNRINAFQNENSISFIHSWNPEYVGEYIHTDLNRLIKYASKIAKGNIKIYETVKIAFDPSPQYFIFEPVSEQELRIAFRTRVSQDIRAVVPESACGHVVNRCSLCQSVSEVAHQYLNDLNSMEVIGSEILVEEFEGSLTELDNAIKNCEQTPPKMDSSV